MKTAIITDYLIERDEATEMLEVILALFPEAPLFCLTHQPGLSGTIEQRRIESTYLTHVMKSPTDVARKSFLIPKAVIQLNIDEFDFLFIFSRGFIHEIPLKSHQKAIVYMLEYDQIFKNHKLGLTRLFKPYVNTWRKPHLAANKKYIFSNSHLPVLENSKVIAPFFQSAKVPFGEGVGERYYLNANQLTRGELSGITGMFIALDLPLTVVSKNKKISSMHPMGPVKFSKMFEEIPSDLKTYIDLGDYDYPASLLSVLCAGKPVIARKNHFFKDELVKSVNTIAQLKDAVMENEKNLLLIDRKKLRREALKYNGRIFKSRLQQEINTFK